MCLKTTLNIYWINNASHLFSEIKVYQDCDVDLSLLHNMAKRLPYIQLHIACFTCWTGKIPKRTLVIGNILIEKRRGLNFATVIEYGKAFFSVMEHYIHEVNQVIDLYSCTDITSSVLTKRFLKVIFLRSKHEIFLLNGTEEYMR